MPTIKSKSKEAIGKNIEIEKAHGKSYAQALAIALSIARKAGAKIARRVKGKSAGLSDRQINTYEKRRSRRGQ